jgi:serine/threonine protein kinase
MPVRTDPPEVRSEMSEAATQDFTGHRVGNSYRLTEPIGGGATGSVWRAVDLARGVEVAIKLLRGDLMQQPKAVTRFVQERAILLMLRHPNIVRVRDLLTVGESLGLVMDLVDSGSLRDCLREQGTLPPALAATLLSQVAGALAEAHRNGVVHRDLKPDNILLDRSSGTIQTRLTDFGIARLLDNPGLTTSGAMVGTANYLAPETIYGGKAAPPVDVYALGVVLFELLAGRPPYSGGPAWTVLRRHVDESPQPVDGMPPAAWRVIEICMDRRPGRRPSAEELVTTLRSLARHTAGLPALTPLAADESPVGPDEREHAAADDRSSAPLAAEGRSSAADPPSSSPAGGGRALEPFGDRAPSTREPRRAIPWPRVWSLVAFVVMLATIVLGFPAWWLLDMGGQARPREPAFVQPSKPLAASRVPGVVADPAAAPPGHPAPLRPSGAAPEPVVAARSGSPAVGYGPWQCNDGYTWDFGHPVIARPCYALGGGIRIIGHARALPGVQADVSLTLVDTASGVAVGGPHVCPGLMFTDLAPEQSCGPFETSPPHGHRYVVVVKWQYTGRGVLPTGTAQGLEFDW